MKAAALLQRKYGADELHKTSLVWSQSLTIRQYFNAQRFFFHSWEKPRHGVGQLWCSAVCSGCWHCCIPGHCRSLQERAALLCAPALSAAMDHCSCLLVLLLCLAFPVAVSPLSQWHLTPSLAYLRKSCRPYGSVSPS